jgi:hypothetical protein
MATGIRVECYAGYRAEESPRRFFIGQREVHVVEIIDRWLDPKHSYFKLHCDDGGTYILRHNLQDHTWAMTAFDGGSRR